MGAKVRAQKIAPFVKPNDVVFEYGVGQGWNLLGLLCERRVGYDVRAFSRPY